MLRPHVGQSSPLEFAYGVELDLVQIIIVGKEMYSGYANICHASPGDWSLQLR